MTGRPFSIGARYMNGFELSFRIVQLSGECLDIDKVSFIRCGANSAEKRQPGKKVFDRLGVIHMLVVQKSDQLLFLKSPRFQAWMKSAQARGLKIFCGGFWPV